MGRYRYWTLFSTFCDKLTCCAILASQSVVMNPFALLPLDWCVEILTLCSISEISSFGRTCKFCHELAENNVLWQKKVKQKWPEKILNAEEWNVQYKELYFKWDFEEFLNNSQLTTKTYALKDQKGSSR